MATKKKVTEEVKAVEAKAEKAATKVKTTAKKVAADVKAEEKKVVAKAKAVEKKVAAKKPAAKKPAEKKPVAKKTPKNEVIIQSPMGGEITPAEVLAKVGPVDQVYVRVDENKAYWVRGEETGSVDLW